MPANTTGTTGQAPKPTASDRACEAAARATAVNRAPLAAADPLAQRRVDP